MVASTILYFELRNWVNRINQYFTEIEYIYHGICYRIDLPIQNRQKNNEIGFENINGHFNEITVTSKVTAFCKELISEGDAIQTI